MFGTKHYDLFSLSTPQGSSSRHSLSTVDIPDDVLDRILHFLPAKDHARCQAVCKSWAARPWGSISLASKADWCDKAQSLWFCSVAGRSSSTLHSVQLQFQVVDSWEVSSMLMCIRRLTRLTTLDLGYKNPAIRMLLPHLGILAPLAKLEKIVCTVDFIGKAQRRVARPVSLQEFAKFPLLQHLAISFCQKASNQQSYHFLQLDSSSEGFSHLKTLRLDSLREIVINSSFKRLVARLEELEVTDLAVLIPEGALEAPLMRKFTYDCGHREPDQRAGNEWPLTATHSLRELTWHGDSFFFSVQEAVKVGKLESIKLRLYPGIDEHHGHPTYTGYNELRHLELPALRTLKIDLFEADDPFVLHIFVQFLGLESLDIQYSSQLDRTFLPSYGFLENLHFLKVTTDKIDLGSGFQYLRALKVLHLRIDRIRGQLQSDSLEVLKLMCQTIEQPQSEAKFGPFGYLPRLTTVELKAPLNTRMEVLALAYGLGGLGNVRSLVLLRNPDFGVNGEDDQNLDYLDIDFLGIILQGLSNRQSQFDRIILQDLHATCSLRRSLMPRVRHLEIGCKAAELHESCHGRNDWMDDTAFLRLRMSAIGHPGIAPLVESLKQSKRHMTRRKLKAAPWNASYNASAYDGPTCACYEYVEAKGEDCGLTPEYITPLWTVDSEIV